MFPSFIRTTEVFLGWHIPMHFVLLYFIPVAFSKRITCISRYVRELLFPVYVIVLLAKVEVFSFFSLITILLMPLFYLIFSKSISANIMYRIRVKGYPWHTPLFTVNACDKCPFTLTDPFFYVLMNSFYFLHHFGSILKLL